MRFQQFKHWLPTIGVVVPVEPGPVLPEWPGSYVLLSPISSPGHGTDGVTDTAGWQVRAVGEQGDYDSAESLAWAIDDAIMLLNGTTVIPEVQVDDETTIAAVRVISGYRVGSPPTVLQVDDAGRHHFVCSYLFVVGSAVAVR